MFKKKPSGMRLFLNFTSAFLFFGLLNLFFFFWGGPYMINI